MTGLKPRIPADVVLAGVAAAVVLMFISSVRYPGIFRLPGAGAVLALTAVMLLGYATCAVWALWRPGAGRCLGISPMR